MLEAIQAFALWLEMLAWGEEERAEYIRSGSGLKRNSQFLPCAQGRGGLLLGSSETQFSLQ